MSAITLEATTSTPKVLFDPERSLLELSGESYPENALAFYHPLLEAVTEHLQQPGAALTIDLRLRYLNTSSVRALMELFDLAEESYREGGDLRVVWFHDQDDDRSLDVAEEFREDLTLPFDIVAIDAESRHAG